MCAKLHTVAASNNRDHPTRSLYYSLFGPHTYIFVLHHIPFMVNHTINATPPERLQHYAGSTTLRWCGGTSRLISESNPFAGTNSCVLIKPPIRCRCKQLLSKSTPYAGGTNSCFLNQPLRWWYIPTLEVQPYAGGTDAADQSSGIVRTEFLPRGQTINQHIYRDVLRSLMLLVQEQEATNVQKNHGFFFLFFTTTILWHTTRHGHLGISCQK